MKALSDTTLSVVRQMFRVMAPPCAVVVPDMMIPVASVSDGQDRAVDECCGHGVFLSFTPGTRTRKSARPVRKGAYKAGEIFVQRISPAAHRRAFALHPPWDFSFPGWQPLVSPKGIPDAPTLISETGSQGKPTCVSYKQTPVGRSIKPHSFVHIVYFEAYL